MLAMFARSKTRRLINQAFDQHALTQEARDRALALVPVHTAWWWGVDRLLLALGSAHLLAGILFFFAYNWADMPPMVKFSILQVAILVCLGIGIYKGYQNLVSKISLLSAALILGVLLAFYGQVYQTGADSYELFRAWSVLILPWVVLLRFKSLWILWLVIANLGLVLFFDQAGYQLIKHDDMFVPIILTAFNAAVLVVGELWQKGDLPQIPVLTALLIFSDIPLFAWIVDNLSSPTTAQMVALPIWLVIHGLLFAFFRYRRPDFNAFALTVLSMACMVCSLLVRFTAEINAIVQYLLAGLVIMAAISTSTLFLYRVKRAMGSDL